MPLDSFLEEKTEVFLDVSRPQEGFGLIPSSSSTWTPFLHQNYSPLKQSWVSFGEPSLALSGVFLHHVGVLPAMLFNESFEGAYHDHSNTREPSIPCLLLPCEGELQNCLPLVL